MGIGKGFPSQILHREGPTAKPGPAMQPLALYNKLESRRSKRRSWPLGRVAVDAPGSPKTHRLWGGVAKRSRKLERARPGSGGAALA